MNGSEPVRDRVASRSSIAIAALCIGLLIVAQGIVGLIAPALFVDVVRVFQTPPVLYFAAVIRFTFGVVLVLAAPGSRARLGLRALGLMIAIGGLITPFIGVPFARVVLGWWSEGGAPVVRLWAFAALILGSFITYATTVRPRPA